MNLKLRKYVRLQLFQKLRQLFRRRCRCSAKHALAQSLSLDDGRTGHHRFHGVHRRQQSGAAADDLRFAFRVLRAADWRTGARGVALGRHSASVHRDGHADVCALFGAQRRHDVDHLPGLHGFEHRHHLLHHCRHLRRDGPRGQRHQDGSLALRQHPADGAHRPDCGYGGEHLP